MNPNFQLFSETPVCVAAVSRAANEMFVTLIVLIIFRISDSFESLITASSLLLN